MTTLTLTGSWHFVGYVLKRLSEEFAHDGNAYRLPINDTIIAATTLINAPRSLVLKTVADAYTEDEPRLAKCDGFTYSWDAQEVEGTR